MRRTVYLSQSDMDVDSAHSMAVCSEVNRDALWGFGVHRHTRLASHVKYLVGCPAILLVMMYR